MSLSSSQKAALTRVVGDRVRWHEPLASWTTLRVGGPADALVTLLAEGELQQLLACCRREEIPWKLLGRGSNVLAADSGFPGVIIVLGEGFAVIERLEIEPRHPVTVRAGAAVGLTGLAQWCCREGLAGLEFAAGIPGTLGGAVCMNAGAWGREMAEIIRSVALVDGQSSITLARDELAFGYRCCDGLVSRDPPGVVTEIEMQLEHGHPEEIAATMKRLRTERLLRQPQGLPTAGSIFKNPPGTSAGRLIDAAGLKGRRIGDAQISEKHANFLVNVGKATAGDIIALIEEVREQVQLTSGIALEPEIEFLHPLVNHEQMDQ